MVSRTTNVLGAWLLAAGGEVAASAGAAGLSAGEAAAVVLVANNPGRSLDWLRGRLGLSHSGTVRLVDRLGALGLLRRGAAVHDGRMIALTLTGAGAERVARIHAARADVVDRLLSGLPAAAGRELVELAAAQLRRGLRTAVQADVTCRLCDVAVCAPHCPVDDSVPGLDRSGAVPTPVNTGSQTR
jgi:DNA-binding MarR family transcriptional regulator